MESTPTAGGGTAAAVFGAEPRNAALLEGAVQQQQQQQHAALGSGGGGQPATATVPAPIARLHDAGAAAPAGAVPSGPFKGMERAAAMQLLNESFTRDLALFVADAAPGSVDLSSCMQQYLSLASEINRCS